MILKDTHRSIKSPSPTTSRPHTATTSRSVSQARVQTSRSVKSGNGVRTLPPVEAESCEKRDASSKEALVQLFSVWQPQLCASYRPHVEYSPTDPDTIQAYVNAMVVGKQHSPRLEKFRAVERVVETVNHFNHTNVNQQHRGRDSRMSQGHIKT